MPAIQHVLVEEPLEKAEEHLNGTLATKLFMGSTHVLPLAVRGYLAFPSTRDALLKTANTARSQIHVHIMKLLNPFHCTFLWGAQEMGPDLPISILYLCHSSIIMFAAFGRYIGETCCIRLVVCWVRAASGPFLENNFLPFLWVKSGFLSMSRSGSKVGKKVGFDPCSPAFAPQTRFHRLLNHFRPLTETHLNPTLNENKLFSRQGPEVAPTQHKACERFVELNLGPLRERLPRSRARARASSLLSSECTSATSIPCGHRWADHML